MTIDSSERVSPMDYARPGASYDADASEDTHYLAVATKRHPSGLASVVHLEGHLDDATVALFRQKLAPIIVLRPRVLAFDMARLKFLSSAGIGALVYARRTQAAWGGTIRLLSVPPRIRRVFDVLDALPANAVFSDVRELDRYLAAIQRGETDDAPAAPPHELRVQAGPAQ